MASKKEIKKKLLQGKAISLKEQAKLAAPRNLFALAAAQGNVCLGGKHADKRLNSRNGKIKHKKPNFGY